MPILAINFYEMDPITTTKWQGVVVSTLGYHSGGPRFRFLARPGSSSFIFFLFVGFYK